MKTNNFTRNVFIIIGFFFLGILVFFSVIFLEINKVLGDLISYFKKIIKK